MRELTSHKVNGVNDGLIVTAADEPGSGGAHHGYSIRWKNERDKTEPRCYIGFQDGSIKEVGVNGVTHEALLAIVIDRLQCFQKGPFACRENAIALTKIEEAMHWLQHRTNERLRRGVEGTMNK